LLPKEQVTPPLQQLLAERLKLTFHRETKTFPGYTLVVTKGGSKPQAAKEGGSKGGSIWRGGIPGPRAMTKMLAGISETAGHWIETGSQKPREDAGGRPCGKNTDGELALIAQ
jgi:uncharacterized protein (TIGR03435 family)